MNTVLVEKNALKEVVELVKDSQVVAFPTETVFGLGIKFGSYKALDALYELKQRDKGKAISIMISNPKDIDKYAYVTKSAEKLIEAFMPGMLTIILKKRSHINDYFTASLDTIGIRIPDDDFVLSLLEMSGPMLVTSANLSGEDSLVNDQAVLNVFDGKIPLIVRGESISKKASTIVDLSKDKVEILRLGDISKEQIEEVLDENCNCL